MPRGDLQPELVGALVDRGIAFDHVGVHDVEIEMNEEVVQQPLAGIRLALDLPQREPAVRPQFHVPVENLSDEFPPRAGRAVEWERNGVEVHPVDPLRAEYLGPRVTPQPGDERGLVGECAEHLQVGGVQHALQRDIHLTRHPAKGFHHLLARQGDPVGLPRLVVSPTGWQRELRIPADDVPPVLPVLA